MPKGPSLADWLRRLESVTAKEIVLGLERVQAVLEQLDAGRPELVIHVAGTNGKGSSVAMLAAILEASGMRVGAYTSPHLVRYNERIVIDGDPAGDAEIIAAFEAVESARGDVPLTYFEFGTLAAWLVFLARDVDVAILEVGLGGRLDAVNAIEPDVGLITSIGLDHQDWLGDTLEEIAREKAGIMRSGKPTVFAASERPAAIDATSVSVGAALLANGRDFRIVAGEKAGRWNWQGRSHVLEDLAPPALPGEVQLANAGGVLALLEAVGIEPDAARISAALAEVTVPGRMQRHEDSHTWLFDVAHNPAAATALASTLAGNSAARRVAIVGMLETKDVERTVAPLTDVIDEWMAVTATGNRALPAAELGRRIANALNRHCQVIERLDEALAEARRVAGQDGEIVVFGSFNIVGPAQESLGL